MIEQIIQKEKKRMENILMKSLNENAPFIKILFQYILINKYTGDNKLTNDNFILRFTKDSVIRYSASFFPSLICPYQLLVLRRATPEELKKIRANGWDIGEL